MLSFQIQIKHILIKEKFQPARTGVLYAPTRTSFQVTTVDFVKANH